MQDRRELLVRREIQVLKDRWGTKGLTVSTVLTVLMDYLESQVRRVLLDQQDHRVFKVYRALMASTV